MKKIFTLAAATLIATSCTEVETLSPTTTNPEGGKKISISVSTPDNIPSTRIAVSEDTQTGNWITSWIEEDVIGCFAFGDMMFADFAVEKLNSKKNATFVGYAYGDKVRLVYPTSADFVYESKYAPNLAEQDVTIGEMANLSKHSYMISSEIISGVITNEEISITPPMMEHVGAALNLSLRFEGLKSDATASISKIEIGGNGGIDIPTSVEIDLSKLPNETGAFTYGSDGMITLNVAENTIKNYDNSDATTYSIPFNILPFDVAIGESLAIKTYISYKNSKGVVSDYIVDTYATNSGTDKIRFEKGYNSYINKTINAAEAEAVSRPVSIVDQTVNPLIAHFDIEINEDECDGYAYDWSYTATGAAGKNLANMVKYGMAEIVTEEGQIAIGKEGSFISGATDYTLAIMPVKKNGEKYVCAGELYSYNFTTPTLTTGIYDNVDMKYFHPFVSETSSGFTVAATRHTATIGFYYGCAKYDDVEDINTYVAELLAGETMTLDYVSFTNEGTAVGEEFNVEYYGLEPGTHYIAFAIPVTPDGGTGKLAVQDECYTTAVQINDNYTPAVSVESDESSMKATIDFGDCFNVFYFNQKVGAAYAMSDDDIKIMFYADVNDLVNGSSLTETITDGNGKNILTFEQGMLETETTYRLYYMGADKTGTYFGDLHYIEYTTEAEQSTSYPSKAAVTVTENTDSSTVTTDAYGTIINLALNVTLNEFADSYWYGSIPEARVADTSSVSAWGDALLAGYTRVESSETSVKVELTNSTQSAVFVPMDKDGKYGKPVVVSSSLWPDKETDTDTDTGIMPF